MELNADLMRELASELWKLPLSESEGAAAAGSLPALDRALERLRAVPLDAAAEQFVDTADAERWLELDTLGHRDGRAEGERPSAGEGSASPAADLCFLSVEEASRLIAARDLSPVELTQAYLAAIERNERLNAYITVTPELALEQAREAEAAIGRGERRGPLHGIPMAFKDIIHVAGVRTTGGSRILGDDFVPAEDAFVVERLREAGAVFLGKLHTHELAGGGTSINEWFGPARNPWDPSRIPGGSSGGSAIATAAGLACATLGTDTGGSIRTPSAICGVVGLKPTFGRVSLRGVLRRSLSADCAGPIVRRVRDAAIVLNAIAGHDPRESRTAPKPVPDDAAALSPDVRGLRVGVLTGPTFEQDVDAEVLAGVRAACKALQELGVEVVPLRMDLAEEAFDAVSVISLAESAAIWDEAIREHPERIGRDVREKLQQGELVTAPQYLRAMRVRTLVQRELGAMFEHVSALVCATTMRLPQVIEAPSGGGRSSLRTAGLTRLFSLAGCPALSVPCGFSASGLPLGMQIAGRPWDEAGILSLALAYEQATAWHERRPPID